MEPSEYDARLADDDANFSPVRIVDISEKGAKLALAAPGHLPDEFTLLLSPDGFIQRRCRLVWQSVDRVGVEFTAITRDARFFTDVDHLNIALQS
jgi:hypothetical protein